MSSSSNLPRRLSISVAPRQQQNKKMISSEKLSRQLSNVSNEDYHGGEPASVPFNWESQPGTPKVMFRETSLPPLTPPPSYSSSTIKRPAIKAKKNPKSSIFQTIFPKRSTRKGRVPSVQATPASPSMSCSSSSCSSSYSSSPRPASQSVPSSPVIYARKEEEDEDLYDHVPLSSLCFGNAWSRGCYSGMMKKELVGDFP